VATTPEDEIMAVKHRSFPLWGVQFHPESVLTEHGYALLGNFLSLSSGAARPSGGSGTRATEDRRP
jgi:GMP synthase-like glutamine amidotransferase